MTNCDFHSNDVWVFFLFCQTSFCSWIECWWVQTLIFFIWQTCVLTTRIWPYSSLTVCFDWLRNNNNNYNYNNDNNNADVIIIGIIFNLKVGWHSKCARNHLFTSDESTASNRRSESRYFLKDGSFTGHNIILLNWVTLFKYEWGKLKLLHLWLSISITRKDMNCFLVLQQTVLYIYTLNTYGITILLRLYVVSFFKLNTRTEHDSKVIVTMKSQLNTHYWFAEADLP